VRKGSIRDARLKSGAPLLVGHDSDRQVGVMEAFEITPAKKLRVLARFSKSAYAEEIWQDVLDGIRRNTSVGYIIHDLVLEKQEEDVSTYRVTDWEPLEGSLVAVPADHTVGVGRSHEPASPPNPPRTKETMETRFGDGARHIIGSGAQLRGFTKPVHYSDGSKMEPIEAAYRSGQWLLATVGQNAKAQRWCRENGLGDHIELRVGTTDSDTVGGYTVPDEMEQSIIDLRASTASRGASRAGARWRATPSRSRSARAASPPTSSRRTTPASRRATRAGPTSTWSRRPWRRSRSSARTSRKTRIDVVDDLVQEQAYAFALKEDQCWLIGDGTSTYGGMQGLITLFEATALRLAHAATSTTLFAEYDNTDLTAVMGGVADFPGLEPGVAVLEALRQRGAEPPEGHGGRQQRADARGPAEGRVPGLRRLHLGDHAEGAHRPLGQGERLLRRLLQVLELRRPPRHHGPGPARALRREAAGRHPVDERFHIVNHDVGDTTVKGPVAALYGD
jgi:hypothetical protein